MSYVIKVFPCASKGLTQYVLFFTFRCFALLLSESLMLHISKVSDSITEKPTSLAILFFNLMNSLRFCPINK